MRKLTTDEADYCAGILEPESLDNMIKLLKDDKSPGMDGLPGEFYKTFWKELRSLLFKCIEYSVEKGQLSETQRKGIVASVLKKGKNPALLQNYRLVTLLNTDYKTITTLYPTS